MSTPYVAARSLMNVRQKLREINWGFVLLVTAIACIGFAMLYSAAGGSLSPAGRRVDLGIVPDLGPVVARAPHTSSSMPVGGEERRRGSVTRE